MTYFGFLLRFLIIPIIILFITTWRKTDQPFWIVILIHMLLAVAYTTPWDNYLVATHVWYYNPKLVTGVVLGYVPIEEYTFFVLQTILAGLWWRFLSKGFSKLKDFKPSQTLRSIASFVLLVAWIFFTVLFLIGSKHFTYLSITLSWALPAMIPQMLFGADILWRQRKLLARTILPPAFYLSLVDSLAIRFGTWTIDSAQSTGIFIGPLPLEEAVFFFITMTLVAFGITLLLSKESQGRWTEIKKTFKQSSARMSR